MPSHGPVHSIGKALDSDGHPVTAIMWRANGLVDSLAKAAASPHRVPQWFTSRVAVAGKMVQHQVAKLGVVTHSANNHPTEVTLENGEKTWQTARDSTALGPGGRRPTCRAQLEKPRASCTTPQQRVTQAIVALEAAGGGLPTSSFSSCKWSSSEKEAFPQRLRQVEGGATGRGQSRQLGWLS